MNSLPLNELIRMNASGMSHRSESSVKKSVRTALPGEKRGRETAGIGAFAAAEAFAAADALESGRSESDGVLAASAATAPEAASDWVFAVPDVERAALLLVALTGRPPSNG